MLKHSFSLATAHHRNSDPRKHDDRNDGYEAVVGGTVQTEQVLSHVCRRSELIRHGRRCPNINAADGRTDGRLDGLVVTKNDLGDRAAERIRLSHDGSRRQQENDPDQRTCNCPHT